MKFASDITRVPCGRTDVLIGANDAPSLELSYRRGLEGASFNGFSKIGTLFVCSKSGSQNWKNYGRIWSYRGLDTTILKHCSRSTRWAWFQRQNKWTVKIKTRAGFGRTEVSIPPFWSFIRDLQGGHDFKGKQKWTVKTEKNNKGRIWSYRGLDAIISKLFLRSARWARF